MHSVTVDLGNPFSKRVSLLLGAVVLSLFALHWAGVFASQALGEEHFVARNLVKLFWVDLEYNVPAWFSSCLLWTCGFLMLGNGLLQQGEGAGFKAHWIILGIVFGLMSLDEAIAVHEWMIVPLREALDLGGVFYFAWVIPAIVILVLGVVLCVPFLRSLPSNLRRVFITGGSVFIAGAIGMEMLGGAAKDGYFADITYYYLMPVEELLEMTGIVIFIHGLTALHAARTHQLRP